LIVSDVGDRESGEREPNPQNDVDKWVTARRCFHHRAPFIAAWLNGSMLKGIILIGFELVLPSSSL
jgi:hypothetical protein